MSAPVNLSLSEIEAIALKAARGAGFSWGLAEEAAFAARWLAEQGLDGLTPLARHLDRSLGENPGAPPVFHDGRWTSGTSATLCPIAAGAALSDHFNLPEGPAHAVVRLCNLSVPALVLPFLAAAGARSGVVVLAAWSGCSVVLSSGSILTVLGAEDLMSDLVAEMTVTTAPARAGLPVRTAHAKIPAATRQLLDAFVGRTHVPASAQSRRGAGADGIDDT